MKPGLVVVRADGSAALGLGHLTRSGVLADALGAERTMYISRDTPEARRMMVGREARFLPTAANAQADAVFVRSSVTDRIIDVMVVDMLTYPTGYLDMLHGASRLIVTLNENETECPGSDLLVNYNALPESDAAGGSHSCLGPAYVVLRPQILARKPRSAVGSPLRVLVTMGGSDPNGITLLAARGLAALRHDVLPVLHIGPAFVREDMLGALRALRGVEVRERVTDLSQLMAEADIAVAAGGNTMYELCFLGVPTIVIAQNDHQARFARVMATAGCVLFLGLHSEVTDRSLAVAVDRLREDGALRRSMASRARSMIDGRGTERLSQRILEEYRKRNDAGSQENASA